MKDKIFTGLFALLLAALSVLTLALPKKDFSPNENRPLETAPALSVEAVKSGEFTKGVSAYLTDHFAGRDAWVSVKALAELATGKRENGGVYLSKNGGLIDGFTEDDLEYFEKNLQALREFTEFAQSDYGVRVQSIIAPTATQICAEDLPAFSAVADADALYARLTEVPGFIDLRDTLTAHKDEYVYYRTDHHWTGRGAYLAYAAYDGARGETPLPEESFLPETVTTDFHGSLYSRFGLFMGIKADTITAPAASALGNVSMTDSHGDTHASVYFPEKLESKDKYLYFTGPNDSILRVKTEADTGKRLLLIKDSYANAFLPYLLKEFDEITVIDLRYYKDDVSALLENENYTDALVLYNLKSFASDSHFRFVVY